MKDSSARLRVDSLIKAYKAAEDTYNKDDKHSLSLWCMANVNCFLDITEGKNFNIEPSESQLSRASEDLEKFNSYRLLDTKQNKNFFSLNLNFVLGIIFKNRNGGIRGWAGQA